MKAKAKAKVKVADLKTSKKAGRDKLKNVKGGAYTSLVTARTLTPKRTSASEGPCWESTFCY